MSERHSRSGTQYEPASVTAIFSPGKRSNTPDQQQEPQRPRRSTRPSRRVEPEHAGHRAVVVVRARDPSACAPGGRATRTPPRSGRSGSWCTTRTRPTARGMMMPPHSPSPCARVISAMAPSMSPRIGATIRPARRCGLSAAELGGPAVVRTRAGEHELGIGGAVDGEAGAERRAHLAGDRVGAGEHHLAGHAVGRRAPRRASWRPSRRAARSRGGCCRPRPRRTTPPGTPRSPAKTSSSVPKRSRRICCMSASRAASSSSNWSRYCGSRNSRYTGESGPAWQSAEMTR